MQRAPYGKRSVRARLREVRLRELGYDTYDAYLKSPAWRDVKARYRASDLPQICMCGETRVQLHHTTYERVGREHLEDLIPLCEVCHADAHALEASGAIELDLKGFYFDEGRAIEGRQLLDQIEAACPPGSDMRAVRQRALSIRRARKKGQRGRQMHMGKNKPTPKATPTSDIDLAGRTFIPEPAHEYVPGRYDDLLADVRAATDEPVKEPRYRGLPSAIDPNRSLPRHQ